MLHGKLRSQTSEKSWKVWRGAAVTVACFGALVCFAHPAFFAYSQDNMEASARGSRAQVGQSNQGAQDQLGRLSLNTAEVRSEVLSRVAGTAIYDLAQDYFLGMPSFTAAGDPPFQYWITHNPRANREDNPFGVSDKAREVVAYSGDAFAMYSHTGTHIDALNHFGLHGKVWNGFEADQHLGDKGWNVNGADRIPPIIARGILIDVLTSRGVTQLPPNHRITAHDIRSALEAQNTELRNGDVVLLRTGQGAHFHDPSRYEKDAAGLSVDGAVFLADQGAMVVGMDVMNPEVLPSGLHDNWIPVHTFLLAEKGIPIIENLNLEALAADRVYQFAFIGIPLKIRGATGSPIRPIALPLAQKEQRPVADR